MDIFLSINGKLAVLLELCVQTLSIENSKQYSI